MKLHFISGMPRSGSTLLAAILRQNPRFHAAMTSPVSTAFVGVENTTHAGVETSAFISDEYRQRRLRSCFTDYYSDYPQEVVFDTSRQWCARLPLLAQLYPKAKVIACVREIGWVLDSFERIYRKNSMKPSAINGWATSGTVFSRTASLASSSGVVGFAIDALQEAHAATEAKGRLLLIDYERLTQSPETTLRKLYEFIGEDWFAHDFSNVEYEAGEFDRALGAQGLHTIKGAVEWRPRKSVLPQTLFDRFNGPNFWRSKEVA